MISGHPAYLLVGTYDNPGLGPQKVLETGTIIDGIVYALQYNADSSKYNIYLSTLNKMIDSLQISLLSMNNFPLAINKPPFVPGI
jgi:hypothetical protein